MTQIEQVTVCLAVIQSGRRKGEECGRPAKFTCDHCGWPVCHIHRYTSCGCFWEHDPQLSSRDPDWLKPTGEKVSRL